MGSTTHLRQRVGRGRRRHSQAEGCPPLVLEIARHCRPKAASVQTREGATRMQ